jgi:hypothetical protein
MPSHSYSLTPGGPQRLVVSWRGVWKDVTIELDGSVVGTIPDQKALSAGQQFALPDGSSLSIQLVQKLTVPELVILHDGQPLPGSASDPQTRLRTAYGMVFLVAGLNIVLGILACVLQVEFLRSIGISVYSLVFGVVFLLLGFLVKRRSLAALVIAVLLFALDGILGAVFSILQGDAPSTAGLLARVALLVPMIQGISAIRQVRE